MILTGHEIVKQRKKGNIVIEPFVDDLLEVNSYNYRLGEKLKYLDDKGKYQDIAIPKEGYVIEPHRTYLGHTFETLGSKKFAMSLIGKNSLGRLGLFLQVSANLIHTGSVHKITLEIVSTKPFRLYPNMVAGQISFWQNKGRINKYSGDYAKFSLPQISKIKQEK